MSAVCQSLQSLPCSVAAIGSPPAAEAEAQSQCTAPPGALGPRPTGDTADAGLGGDDTGCGGIDGLAEGRGRPGVEGVEGVEPAVRRSIELLVSVDQGLGGDAMRASLSCKDPLAQGRQGGEAQGEVGGSGWMQPLEALALEVARAVDQCVQQVTDSPPCRPLL